MAHMVELYKAAWAYKASGSLKADLMFLVVEGACAVLEDCAFHSVACSAIRISKPVFSMHMGFQGILKVWKVYQIGWGWARGGGYQEKESLGVSGHG
eukprot:260680-Pelagomonas_calceolata.AAC.1